MIFDDSILICSLLLLVLSFTNANNEEMVISVNSEKELKDDNSIESNTILESILPFNGTQVVEEPTVNVTKIGEIVEPSNKTQKFVNCVLGMGTAEVQLTNDTELIKLLQPDPKVTDREVPGLCVVVLFYSKHCPFSSMAAPHYNALPRAFPDIKLVAINAMMYHLFNTQNGIVGVPSLLLFHNGRSVGKFNGSEYSLEKFSQFIYKHTGLAAVESVAVTSGDFSGPVTNIPAKDYDMFLILSWLFIILCGGYYFTKSKWWKWIVESIQSNWRESEVHAQHEHID